MIGVQKCALEIWTSKEPPNPKPAEPNKQMAKLTFKTHAPVESFPRYDMFSSFDHGMKRVGYCYEYIYKLKVETIDAKIEFGVSAGGSGRTIVSHINWFNFHSQED